MRRILTLQPNGSFAFSHNYNPALKAEIKQLPQAVWKWDHWEVPSRHAPTVYQFATDHQFQITSSALDRIRLFTNYYNTNATQSGKLADTFTCSVSGLLPFQQAAVKLMVQHKRTLLGDDPGLGKTLESLAAVKTLGAFPLVVVAPAIVKYKWQDEVTRWLGMESQVLEGKSQVVGGTVTILNPDILSRHLLQLKALKPQAIIIDESHVAKNMKAKRTQLITQLCDGVPVRYLLTGTPVVNRPNELLSQLEILDRLEAFGGKDYYIKRYCDGYSTGHNNEEELHRRLREVCYIRRDKRDVLPELPPLTHTLVPLEISNRSVYSAHEQSLSDPLTRITLLRQTALKGKINGALDYIRTLAEHNKVVVFAHHVEAVETTAKMLGADFIHGKTPAKQRHEIVKRFQGGKSNVLVMNLLSGSVGIDLYSAHHVVFLELPWTPALLDQAIARCWRLGQKFPVTAHYLVAKDTVEDEIAHLIDQKRRVVEPVTNGTRSGKAILERVGSKLQFLQRQRESDRAMEQREKMKVGK